MNEYWMGAICIAGFGTQLALCFLCRRRLLRLLPVLIPIVIGAVFFGVFYGTGNWAWLLLAVILQNITVAAGAAWLVYGGYRLAKKILLLSSKNT